MKSISYLFITATFVGMVGCASARRVAILEPVGPCQRIAASEGTTDGSLTVYSARRMAGVSISGQEFVWNNDFGRNEFMYEPAHTDYTIYGSDGKVFMHVRNAIGKKAEIPTPVMLPKGAYRVEAEAEMPGTLTSTFVIPVVIEAGQTTTVHLEPTWERPAASPELGDVVRLNDGRVIGCGDQQMIGLNSR